MASSSNTGNTGDLIPKILRDARTQYGPWFFGMDIKERTFPGEPTVYRAILVKWTSAWSDHLIDSGWKTDYAATITSIHDQLQALLAPELDMPIFSGFAVLDGAD